MGGGVRAGGHRAQLAPDHQRGTAVRRRRGDLRNPRPGQLRGPGSGGARGRFGPGRAHGLPVAADRRAGGSNGVGPRDPRRPRDDPGDRRRRAREAPPLDRIGGQIPRGARASDRRQPAGARRSARAPTSCSLSGGVFQNRLLLERTPPCWRRPACACSGPCGCPPTTAASPTGRSPWRPRAYGPLRSWSSINPKRDIQCNSSPAVCIEPQLSRKFQGATSDNRPARSGAVAALWRNCFRALGDRPTGAYGH